MPRIRTIKPEFWSDEKLAPLPPIDRLVFLGLLSIADDKGRLVDNVKAIDGFLFASREGESSRDSLETLASLARITRYTVDSGQNLIQINGWSKHQYIAHPSRYSLPAPRRSEDSVESHDDVPKHSGSDLGSRILDQRSRKGEASRAPHAALMSNGPPSDQSSTAKSDDRPGWARAKDDARVDAEFVRSIGEKLARAGGPAQPQGSIWKDLTADEQRAWSKLGGASVIYERYAETQR